MAHADRVGVPQQSVDQVGPRFEARNTCESIQATGLLRCLFQPPPPRRVLRLAEGSTGSQCSDLAGRKERANEEVRMRQRIRFSPVRPDLAGGFGSAPIPAEGGERGGGRGATGARQVPRGGSESRRARCRDKRAVPAKNFVAT